MFRCFGVPVFRCSGVSVFGSHDASAAAASRGRCGDYRDGVTAARPRSLTEWLRAQSDDALAALFRDRPDVSVPVPADLSVVVTRLSSRPSLVRALEPLDAFTMRVLDAVRLQDDHDADGVRGLFPVASAAAVTAAIDRLRALALVWGDDDDLHVPGAVAQELGPYPAGLGRPVIDVLRSYDDAEMAAILSALHLPRQPQPGAAAAVSGLFGDPTRLRAVLDGCGERERQVLEQLASDPPIGIVQNARVIVRAEDATSPVRWLLAHGLLAAVDEDTVELPREVGRALRGDEPLGAVSPTPPTPAGRQLEPAVVEAAGGGQAAALIRLVESLLDGFSADPPRMLKSGGLGVRELRRTARELDVTEPVAALLLETAYAAGLLGVDDEEWCPTPDYDRWLVGSAGAQWALLGSTWLTMTRLPSLVGMRDDRDHAVNALSPDTVRSSASRLRRHVLDAVAALPEGFAVTVEGLGELLRWFAPRISGVWQRQVVADVLAEAETLGICGRGALTSYGRQLLAGEDPADAVTAHLPEPVDHVLVQADLTVVAPGPLEPGLAREIALVADVESSGGATVYRVTEATVRRALDAGRGADELQELFATRSRTPVPQALSYLIDDAARRHGSVRVGSASAYLRCDDPALMAAMTADRTLESLRLRRIAPTVLLSRAPVRDVVDLLRSRGYAPMPESADGAVVVSAPERRRAPVSRRAGPGRVEAGIAGQQLDDLIRRVRAGDAAAQRSRDVSVTTGVPGVTTASTLALLQEAQRDELAIWIGYVNAEGRATHRVVEPVSIGGGFLHGFDHRRGEMRTFALHRITSVALLDADGNTDQPVDRDSLG